MSQCRLRHGQQSRLTSYASTIIYACRFAFWVPCGTKFLRVLISAILAIFPTIRKNKFPQKFITANILPAKIYSRVCSTTTCLLRLETKRLKWRTKLLSLVLHRVRQIVRIERLPVRVAILVLYVPRGRASGFRGAREEGTSSQTVPRRLSRFDTHPRWSLVTQSARYRRSYGKIGDCEQSTFSPIHFSQIVVVLYFFTSTDPNGFSVVGTMRSVSTRGSSLGCERDPIGL